MQTIEAMEPQRRGFYSGSIGFIDCRGYLDLSVVIRTVIVAYGWVMVQVGGGIVADSDPTSEWDETVAKGELLLQVLGSGSGVAAIDDPTLI
jgi:para-aminobenzoate synthetase component I